MDNIFDEHNMKLHADELDGLLQKQQELSRKYESILRVLDLAQKNGVITEEQALKKAKERKALLQEQYAIYSKEVSSVNSLVEKSSHLLDSENDRRILAQETLSNKVKEQTSYEQSLKSAIQELNIKKQGIQDAEQRKKLEDEIAALKLKQVDAASKRDASERALAEITKKHEYDNMNFREREAKADEKRKQSKKDILELERQIDEIAAVGGDTSELESKRDDLRSEYKKNSIESILRTIGTKLLDGIKDIDKRLDSEFDSAANLFSEYMGKVNARLDGTQLTFEMLTDTVNTSAASNPFYSQKELIKNIATLVDNGIAFNLEDRAYLQTLSEKLVSTFDVLEGWLTRLVRLQQADVTASQMGAEARLTEVLNGLFEDTSYLGTLYDQVSSTLLDATSLLDPDSATSYMYNIQKWLGALYSVGMSESSISSLAQGFNALASGDISSLSSNEQLMKLFGLSAVGSGQAIEDLLTQGIDSSNINDLMKSMIEYLATIAENGNNVLKSQWANTLGISVSDFAAITNLYSSGAVDVLYQDTLNYTSAINQLNQEFESLAVGDRTHISEAINNIIDNSIFDLSSKMASTTGSYLTYKIASVSKDLISDLFGDGSVASLVGGLVKLGGVVSSLSIAKYNSDSGTSDEALTFLEADNEGTGLTAFINKINNIWSFLKRGVLEIVDEVGNIKTAVNDVFAGSIETLAPLDSSLVVRGDGTYVPLDNSSSSYQTVSKSYSSSSSSMQNLNNNYGYVQSSGSQVYGYVESDRTAENIYQQLFENRSTPVKVEIASTSTTVPVSMSDYSSTSGIGSSTTTSSNFGSENRVLLNNMDDKLRDMVRISSLIYTMMQDGVPVDIPTNFEYILDKIRGS